MPVRKERKGETFLVSLGALFEKNGAAQTGILTNKSHYKLLRSRFRATLNFRKFKGALNLLRRNFFNFAKSCIVTCQSLFNNKQWGSPDSFLSYKHLKGKLRVFLTGKTVAIVTSDVMKMTTTYSAMIGHLFDIIIVAATDKDL